MPKKMTTKEFVLKAKEVHGDKYDYSKVVYKLGKEKVIIICPEHGEFPQRPINHLMSNGCPDCGQKSGNEAKRITFDGFLVRAIKDHGNKYDYSKVDWQGTDSKITIICPEHGNFEQRAADHLRGRGCKGCKSKKLSDRNRETLESFVSKAIEKHGDKYDYSKTIYIHSKEKVTITCRDHGDFQQAPSQHLAGSGCRKCGIERRNQQKKITYEEFISRAKEIHGEKYDYSKVSLAGVNEHVIIVCPEHGDFQQLPHIHLYAESGCSRCINKSEGRLGKYLNSKFITNKNLTIENKRYDFYLPEYNLIIERDGEQHYRYIENFARGDQDFVAKQQANDKLKTELAKKNGFKIARIPFWLNEEQEVKEIENILTGKPTYPDVPNLEDVLTQKPPK